MTKILADMLKEGIVALLPAYYKGMSRVKYFDKYFH
jgi:hypothetical protein